MKTIIMAGGRGTRISELFPDIPKPLILIEHIPVLEREIESLRTQGFTDIILTVSYMADKIMEFGVLIQYYNEAAHLGNAGALFKLRNILVCHQSLLDAVSNIV